ncbi:class I lanthipeptide [Flavobacterium sp.]|uniref:class I lanthipeptide n=1 Tax=Flavobacterium sp. TaxID=239 RepID=UPI0037510EFA
MKKQNTINKLAFNKAAVTELNDQKLTEVNGGSYGLLSFIVKELLDTRVPIIA